jgi:transitional endoplasmic reticulum ATPase
MSEVIMTRTRLWILRVLIPFGGHKQIGQDGHFRDGHVARMLGLEEFVDTPTDDRNAFVQQLSAIWKEAEATADSVSNCESDEVARRLGAMLCLADPDIDILSFLLEVELNTNLRELLEQLGPQSPRSIMQMLAVCLNRKPSEIYSALNWGGVLEGSGVVDFERGGRHHFSKGISVANFLVEAAWQEVSSDIDDPLTYFSSRIVRSPLSRLTASHFPHLASDIKVLLGYLAQCSVEGRQGVNILVYGEPGTGKSELVRMLATELGMDLYEVASATRFGQILDDDARFRAYRLGQALLSRAGGKLILFDEIEDVFKETDRGPHRDGNASSRKAWVNKLLESNAVPAFWITNDVDVIDRAYLRRFDYVLAMNTPPRSVRSRVLDNYLDGLPVSAEWKRLMADHEALAPAVVERAAKVVRMVKDTLPPGETEQSLTRAIGNTLEVMGLKRAPLHSPLHDGYRLDVLNTDCDLAELRNSLMSQRQGRICLYGPPGTGKTAFGRYIADELDRPLLVRRASDIVSPWLGMTEKNMANMFRQAQEEQAVLLLDEADSFLQERQGAQRGWEITGVNEMLTQIETFEGIFIASTNLMASLDSAALRRFDLKINFDYLQPPQAWMLFCDALQNLGLTPDPNLEPPLARLGCLTPGDFANVARQSRLRHIADARGFLDRLSSECAAKPDGRRRAIGFGG